MTIVRVAEKQLLRRGHRCRRFVPFLIKVYCALLQRANSDILPLPPLPLAPTTRRADRYAGPATRRPNDHHCPRPQGREEQVRPGRGDQPALADRGDRPGERIGAYLRRNRCCRKSNNVENGKVGESKMLHKSKKM